MEKNRKLSTSLTDSRFTGWGWSMIIYALLLYFFFALISTDGQNLFPTAFAAVYGHNPAVLLGYATPASIVGIVGGFIFSRLLVKHSTRVLSAISLILTGATFIIWSYCSSIVAYMIVLMVVMFCGSGLGFVAPTLMANWFPRKKGVALGWATIGAPLSSCVGVLGFSTLLNNFGFHTAFLVLGILVIVLGIITLFWVKDNPAKVNQLPDNMDPEVGDRLLAESGQQVIVEEETIKVSTVLKNGNTWLIAIGFGFLWMVTTGVVSQLIPRMMSVGYAEPQAMMFLTISSAIAIPGSYFWGWLDGKIGTKLASVIYSISYIVALIILILASSQVLIWIGCIFIGLGLGGILNLIPSMVVTTFGLKGFTQANGIVMTIANLIRALAFVIMSVCLGISHGSYTMPYIVFIVIDIIGAVLLALIRTKKKAK
ncbi:MAG: MFS transporter [Lachnospiraceae bacterium]|nr:MFS transporter [Lachnospiraceae bacterium]